MPAWILDDTQFDTLARFLEPEDIQGWPLDRFFLARATADVGAGAHPQNPQPGRRLALQATPVLGTFDVMMDTRAAEILYLHLRQPRGQTKNLAERQAGSPMPSTSGSPCWMTP